MKKPIQKWQESEVFNGICNKALKKGKAQPFSNEFYSKLTTEFNGAPCGEKLRFESTIGQCYFYSLLLAKAMPQSTLIIGTLNNLNSTIRNEYLDEFGHGWVEKDGLVYDTTARLIFDKEFYYNGFDASVKEQHESVELADPHLFFRLGINAVKDRCFLVEQLYNIVKDKLNETLSNINNVQQSLAVVRDEFVIDELNEYFNFNIKR